MSVLESFIHDPLVEWSRTGTFVVGLWPYLQCPYRVLLRLV